MNEVAWCFALVEAVVLWSPWGKCTPESFMKQHVPEDISSPPLLTLLGCRFRVSGSGLRACQTDGLSACVLVLHGFTMP